MSAITIFCDFDGPIADVSERYYATYRRGLAWVQTQAQAQGDDLTVRHQPTSQFWIFQQNRVPDRQLAQWSGLEGQYIDGFLGQVSRIVNHSTLLDYDPVQPQAREGLNILRQCGVRVVLVTLRPPDQVMRFLDQHDLGWAISDLYGMPQVEAAYQNQANHKVERLQAAIAACNRQGYDLRHAWMVGDTEADIMAGQTHGIPTVAVTCGIRSSSYLQSFRPTHLVANLWTACQMLQQRTTLRQQPR